MGDPYQARLDALLADGDLEGAIRAMDAELERSPRDREALHIRASLHALAMDWKGVARDLGALVEVDPKARLNGALANAYRATGDPAAALREADREALAAPEDAGVRSVRARLRRAARDLPGAREDLLEAARLKPDDQKLWLALADVEAELELNQDCLRHVEEAAKLGPDWRCLLRRGAAKNELRRYAEAETDLDAAIFEIADAPALKDQLQAALRQRAWSKFCQGKRDALDDAQSALALDSRDPQALCIRGAILVMQDDPAGRADLDKAISIDPGFALPYAFRGSFFLKKSELAAARRDFAKAAELRPALREVFAEEISRVGAIIAPPMAYLPLTPAGRADDLMVVLVRAEERRYARIGGAPPEKTASARAWIEPLGNLAGRLVYAAFSIFSGAALGRLQLEAWKRLAAPDLFPFEPGHPRLAEARRLIEEVSRGSPPPALLCLFTHPPVTGRWLHLNFELTRHAFWALGELRPRASRPRLIVAVDSFALDGFSLFVEGAYAAFMGGLHLGFDRLASHRGALSRALAGCNSWEVIGWRLTRRLAEGGEVGIPLGGGVPITSRALYSAKEFLWEARRRGPPGRAPAEALRALQGEPGFAAFAASPLVGAGLRKSAWRMLEAWLVAVVSGAWADDASQGEGASADLGRLTPAARRTAAACAWSLGLDEAEAAAAVEALDRELGRETPYRRRLFRVLARRVAGRGRALVLLPLAHGRPPDVRMAWGEPVALVGARGDEVTVARAGGVRETCSIGGFARRFVNGNLP